MRFLSLLFAPFVFATALAAQDGPVANGTQIGTWVVVCEAVNVGETDCRLRQTLTVAETGQIVVNLLVAPRGTDQALLVAQVPMGVYLPGGAVFRPSNQSQASQTDMVWQRCAGQVCEAATALSSDDLAAFADAGTIYFGYRMAPQSDPLIVEIGVSSLNQALAALRP